MHLELCVIAITPSKFSFAAEPHILDCLEAVRVDLPAGIQSSCYISHCDMGASRAWIDGTSRLAFGVVDPSLQMRVKRKGTPLHTRSCCPVAAFRLHSVWLLVQSKQGRSLHRRSLHFAVRGKVFSVI